MNAEVDKYIKAIRRFERAMVRLLRSPSTSISRAAKYTLRARAEHTADKNAKLQAVLLPPKSCNQYGPPSQEEIEWWEKHCGVTHKKPLTK